MKKNRFALLFVASTLAAFAATASTTATAGAWRRVSAQQCTSNSANGASGALQSSYGAGFAMVSTGSAGVFECGIVEDMSINDSNVANDWLDFVVPAGGSASAMSCVDYYWGAQFNPRAPGAGGSCTGYTSTSAAGYQSIHTPTDIWNGDQGTYNYPYLHVVLAGSGGQFIGYGLGTN